MSWTSLLKASPTYGAVLTDIIMNKEDLFNRIESAKKGSKATGSKLFKDAFKKYPDLDTNYSSIKFLYEESGNTLLLDYISEEELLNRFSKMKTILGSKPTSRKIEHNAEFFDNLFKSDEEPSNIKDLLVIYQKKIAQSVPQQTRSDYTTKNKKNKEKIYDLYKKYQKKPTIQQFVKNDLPNLDYVLVKLTSSSKMEDEILENNKKLGWNYEKNTFSKIFENQSPTIDEEVEKFEGNFTKKVITSPIRFNFDVEAMDETVDSDKSYKAIEITPTNLSKYFDSLNSGYLTGKDEKKLFQFDLLRVNRDTLFANNKLRTQFVKLLTAGAISTMKTQSISSYKNRRTYSKAWAASKMKEGKEQSTGRKVYEREIKNINEKSEELMLGFSRLTNEQKQQLKEGRRIKGQEELSDFIIDYNSINSGGDEVPELLSDDNIYYNYLKSIFDNGLNISYVEEEGKKVAKLGDDDWKPFDEEKFIDGTGQNNAGRILGQLLNKSKDIDFDNFFKTMYILSFITPSSDDDNLRRTISELMRDMFEDKKDELSIIDEEIDIDENAVNSKIERQLVLIEENFKTIFYEGLNKLIKEIADPNVKAHNKLRANTGFINQMVEHKLLEVVE